MRASRWSPLPVERVSEIAEYIVQDHPGVAESWVNTIFEKVAKWKAYPESGRLVPEINNSRLRELIYGNYRIVYRVEEKWISVLTVRHGGQILPVDEMR